MLDDAWMSCRQPYNARNSLLPQFQFPNNVADFPIETKPPSLPPRNSTTRAFILAFVGLLCTVGTYAILSTVAKPAFDTSKQFAQGVRRVVDSAITQANQQAENNANRHYKARREYLQRRDRRRLNRDAQPEDEDVEALTDAKPSLILRMAALKRAESAVNGIDHKAVEQYFPEWLNSAATWNEDAVLRDLVLAVSHLALEASIDVKSDF